MIVAIVTCTPKWMEEEEILIIIIVIDQCDEPMVTDELLR